LDFYLNHHVHASGGNNSHHSSQRSSHSNYSRRGRSATPQPSSNNHASACTTQTTTTTYNTSGPSVHFERNRNDSCSSFSHSHSGPRDQSYPKYKTPYPYDNQRGSGNNNNQHGPSPHRGRSPTHRRYYLSSNNYNNNYNQNNSTYSRTQGQSSRTFPPRSPSPHPSHGQTYNKPTTGTNPAPPADRPDHAQNRNNSIHDQPVGDSLVPAVDESQYAMQDGDQSSGEDDQFDLPGIGEQCSSLCEEMSSSVQSTSLARILEYSAGMSEVPDEYLYIAQAKEGSFSEPNPAYSLSAVAVEKLGAWHHQKIDPSVYLDVPNTRKIWHQTGVDLKQNLAAKQAVVDPIQLYAACCRAIKKNTVGTMSRPKRSHEINWCLCIIMNINGVNAYTLCDTGSTTDAISPAFAEACKLDIFDLDSVVGLQLDTTGSCSQIKHGALAQAIYSPISAVKYFDVYDIDRYDAIIGTVFMRAHSISVDFEHNVV
jgi:hypothetical protein